MISLVWILGAWNIFVFVLYGIDKYRAVQNKWRISENVLLSCAILMGSLGAALGMKLFRHKTKKPLFKIGIPVAFFINCTILYVVFGRI